MLHNQPYRFTCQGEKLIAHLGYIEQGLKMAVSRSIRVLLVDDHEVVAISLVALFDTIDDIVLVGRAGNGVEAIEQTTALTPDVVLMDLLMPVMDGFEATTLIRKHFPTVKIIAMSASSLHDDRKAAMQAGAHGYVSKDECSGSMICDAIRAVVYSL
jgi:NarL family two-component system response regulator LiaR